MDHQPQPVSTGGVGLSTRSSQFTRRRYQNSRHSLRCGGGARPLPRLVPCINVPNPKREHERIATFGPLRAVPLLVHRVIPPQCRLPRAQETVPQVLAAGEVRLDIIAVPGRTSTQGHNVPSEIWRLTRGRRLTHLRAQPMRRAQMVRAATVGHAGLTGPAPPTPKALRGWVASQGAYPSDWPRHEHLPKAVLQNLFPLLVGPDQTGQRPAVHRIELKLEEHRRRILRPTNGMTLGENQQRLLLSAIAANQRGSSFFASLLFSALPATAINVPAGTSCACRVSNIAKHDHAYE